ncbi:glycosyltransferase [Limnohabitans sp.]|uniref:glycosyltransferase n=1 Tax=Limnohabitans sp. TaxID=1907725 RepID=UPI0038B8EFF5
MNEYKLKDANLFLKNGEYAKALEIYEGLKLDAFYDKLINLNIRKCKSKLENIGPESSSRIIDDTFKGFGIIKNNPLISIIIVSYNSRADLVQLFPTISSQTYQNVEIILLENGEENNEDLCRQFFQRYKYLSADNIGFAEGNNYCYENSSGEFIALVNPDTRLEEGFLQEMIDCIRLDESAAVVAPKIYFYEKYISVTIECDIDEDFSVDISNFIECLKYKKFFVRAGFATGNTIKSDKGLIKLDVPHPSNYSVIDIGFLSFNDFTKVKVTIGYQWNIQILKNDENLKFNFDANTYGSARYIVNNAGSGVDPNGKLFDRGFGEYEDGKYLSKVYLSAFCGCAALIRRAALINRKIFREEFFAYYEDSELSWWIQKNGYKILYCPTAVVYHRHSESTEENSPLWNTLVNRSFLIYNYFTESIENTPFLEFEYQENLISPLILSRLRKYDDNIKKGLIKNNKRMQLCIYDSYFYSMGGGEKHALDIASLFQDSHEVYLASEVDFDIDNLAKYFGIDISKCKKIISTRIDVAFTGKFDVFVNSTFHSNLISVAKKSYYVVSFPHKHVTEDVKNSYTFLHNSEFTSGWAKKFWGIHNSSIIYPLIGYSTHPDYLNGSKKNKQMISVGRLTSEGHCKNHHLIIKAYKLAVNSGCLSGDWRLLIFGSCDLNNKIAYDYYKMLTQISEGYNISININLSRNDLNDAYANSFIYIHAAGLGVDKEEPEKHEHFGITPHEAMRHGCMPIVYEIGGPADQIINLHHSDKFDSVESLSDSIFKASLQFENSSLICEEVKAFAKNRESETERRVLKLVSEVIAN